MVKDEELGEVDAQAETEFRLQKGVTQGLEANALLQNPAFARAKERLEAAYIKNWRSAGKLEDREAFWTRLQVLDDVVLAITSEDGGGKLAAKRLKELERREAAATPRKGRDGK